MQDSCVEGPAVLSDPSLVTVLLRWIPGFGRRVRQLELKISELESRIEELELLSVGELLPRSYRVTDYSIDRGWVRWGFLRE